MFPGSGGGEVVNSGGGNPNFFPTDTVIVGFGDNPAGHGEAWIAVIPEPRSWWLLAVA